MYRTIFLVVIAILLLKANVVMSWKDKKEKNTIGNIKAEEDKNIIKFHVLGKMRNKALKNNGKKGIGI
jgi:hypothetical protein